MRYERFSECLKRVLEEQKLSASEAARLVGFRSRNSIFRILADQTSAKVQEDFLLALKSNLGDQWPQACWDELKVALDITRMGLDDYMSARAMRELIRTGPLPADEITVQLREEGRIVHFPMRQLIRRIDRDSKIDLMICGCCNAALCRILAEELAEMGRRGNVQVTHFVSTNDDVMIQNVVAIQALMYHRWYHAWLVEPGSCTKEMESIYNAGLMFVEVTDRNGNKYVAQTLLSDRLKLYLIKMSNSEDDNAMSLLRASMSSMKPLQNYFPDSTTPEFYLEYTKQYCQVEHDKEIYSIKPDLPLCYVAPDIVYATAEEGFDRMKKISRYKDGTLVQSFLDVHKSRFDNIFNKRKVTHQILSVEAMQRFVQTGKTEDHFFALRPYNVQERLSILRHLREQSANNPYFTIYFLKESSVIPALEISLYEGAGVLFTKADTDYRLTGEHTEAMVTHSGFCRKYREYFLREVLPYRTMSRQESLNVLDELIQRAESMVE